MNEASITKVIILDEKEVNFTEKKNMDKLQGGQISAQERIIFEDEEGKLWRFKSSNIVQEYLGYSAYQALGINIPTFNIGIVSANETNDPGSLIFLQEYLPKTGGTKEEKKEVKQCGDSILNIELSKSVSLIIAIAILGDADGLGRVGDNILLETINGKTSKLIKIDCARTFEALDNNWLQEMEHPVNEIFNNFIKAKKENGKFTEEFINEANKFLLQIKNEEFSAAFRATYQNLNNTFSKLPKQTKYNILRKLKKSTDKQLEPIHLLSSKMKTVDDFLKLIAKNIANLKSTFNFSTNETIFNTKYLEQSGSPVHSSRSAKQNNIISSSSNVNQPS